jgi:glycine oxidase
LISALKAALDADQRVTTLEGDGVDRIVDETAVLASGRTVRAGRMVIAAGHESFAMIGRLIGETLPLGSAVKGQAALLRADVPDDLPLVFQDGLYVVPHGGGLVAIGSTSEDEFDDPYGTDGRLDAVIGRARVLCPLIADATVSARWAGLRPKAAGRDPMIGRLPDVPRVVAATGGFKITLGIAHRMAEIAVGLVLGEEDGGLPDSFSVEAHRGKALEKARRQRG